MFLLPGLIDSISLPFSLERISHLLLSVIVVGAEVFVCEKIAQFISVPLQAVDRPDQESHIRFVPVSSLFLPDN
jgi:hypothetical protein